MKNVKRGVIFSIFVLLTVVFAFSDGFLYPTARILPSRTVELTLGYANLGVAAGLGGNLQIGYALSYHDLGFYARYSPFIKAVLGISYLPFTFCLFGTCENVLLINIYGVYKLNFENENVNVGVRMLSANNQPSFEGFSVFEKNWSAFSFNAEGGVYYANGSWPVNMSISLAKRLWIFNFKVGIVWTGVQKISDLGKGTLALQIKAMLNFGK